MKRTEIKDRKTELKRQSNVTAIEAAGLELLVSESKTLPIMDIETYQRLRTRLYRLKADTGLDIRTEINGNSVKITRYEDEVIR